MNVMMVILIVTGNTLIEGLVPYSSYDACWKSLQYELTTNKPSIRFCMDEKYFNATKD